MEQLEKQKQFNEIYKELSKNIDITQSQYEAAVRSYESVGRWLSQPDSELAPYHPEILPQGSFLTGTMIRPIDDCDTLDVDLVCRLDGKKPGWTQFDLKQIVGNRLKSNGTYGKMLDEEGQRCWTILYEDSSKYHMDILPAIVGTGYKQILEKAFTRHQMEQAGQLAIKITDRYMHNYRTEYDPKFWPKSNPFGYALWFQVQCSLMIRKAVLLSENVNPLPPYQTEKLPLQRVVQLLKRHRNLMFGNDEDKPISIIITTLAARAYQKETDVITALVNIVANMENFIEERYSSEHDKIIKWIGNPVNPIENFADKWPNTVRKRECFYKWLEKLKADLKITQNARGIQLQESLASMFGKKATADTFNNLGKQAYKDRSAGNLFMSSETGMLHQNAKEGTIVKDHNFHGNKD